MDADASHLTIEALTGEIIDLCADIHRTEFRLLSLIRKLDTLEGWNSEMPSCAHWLNVTCGLDLVTAREKVRVAHALADLPAVEDAFRDGRLSYSKVRAITRIATPATQDDLVSFAATTTAAHVERYVRSQRQAARLADSRVALDAYQHRSFSCDTTDDGSLVFEGRLPAEQGAMLRLALERAMEWAYREADQPHQGDCEHGNGSAEKRSGRQRRQEHPLKGVPHAARQADALAALAERFLAAPPSAEEGLSSADRYQVVVHGGSQREPLGSLRSKLHHFRGIVGRTWSGGSRGSAADGRWSRPGSGNGASHHLRRRHRAPDRDRRG